MRHTRTLTIKELMGLPEAEALEYVKTHPVAGGAPDPDPNPDDEPDNDGDPDDTGGSGDSKPGGRKDKMFTKAELDVIVENAVKDRLARKDRAEARKRAEEDGDKDKLIADLQKEIDEDLKPSVQKLKDLEAEVESLSEVVEQQITSILKGLPDSLKDLDLGEEAGPVKRLSWLLEKVVPKKDALNGTPQEQSKRAGNKPGPNPSTPTGKDPDREIAAVVNRRKF